MDLNRPNGSRGQGAGLPTVIMMVALMMTLAFTVVAIAFNHLNLSFKSSNQAKAEHLAEAVLALAIERFAGEDGEEFGIEGSAADKTLQVTFPSLPEGSVGVLSFDHSTALALGVPYSTNNRTESYVEGYGGRSVPGETVHLVAKAEVKGSVSRMEAFVRVPRFPYSIASQGAIRSTGGLLVASVKPGVAYDLNLPISEDDLVPAHMVSNSTEGNSAVVLSGTNKIYGDLQSASGVTLDEGETVVLGETRVNAEKIALPELNVWSYDPGDPFLYDGVQEVHSGAGTLEVKGFNRFGPPPPPSGEPAPGTPSSGQTLTVDNGIKLNGGVLFVDGNLNVNWGGVSGRGAIITTGDLVIQGGGEAASDNQAALISMGNITLKGQSANKAKFSGLVYTEGQLLAEHLRLAGVFVATGDNSDIEFKDTELYQVEDYSRYEFFQEERFELVEVPAPSLSVDGIPIPATYDYNVLYDRLENFKNPNSGASEPPYLFKTKVSENWFPSGYATNEVVDGEIVLVGTSGPDQFVLTGDDLGLRIFGERITTLSQAESVTLSGLEAAFADMGRTMTQQQKDNAKAFAGVIFNANQSGINNSKQAINVALSEPSTGERPDIRTNFPSEISLSEFLSRFESMRVLYWGRFQ